MHFFILSLFLVRVEKEVGAHGKAIQYKPASNEDDVDELCDCLWDVNIHDGGSMMTSDSNSDDLSSDDENCGDVLDGDDATVDDDRECMYI